MGLSDKSAMSVSIVSCEPKNEKNQWNEIKVGKKLLALFSWTQNIFLRTLVIKQLWVPDGTQKELKLPVCVYQHY